MKNIILSISLAVMLALSVGLVGCTAEYVPEITEYNLTISSTEGGSVTTPREGISTYAEGQVVDLVAEADQGYRFVNWTGDIGTITDVEDTNTTITMNDDYSIVANFALGVLIRDWYDLDVIRDNLGVSYILMNDLDSTTPGYAELASATANQGKGWQPITTCTGNFDGQGYKISDLFVDRPDETFVGLFGYVRGGVVIKNVGVVNITVTGKDHVGGLVGLSVNGTVSNSYSTGSVTGDHDVGGLVGLSVNGTVSNSYFTGSVTGGLSIGGLVGGNFGTVSNSYSSANVTGETQIGGLVGDNNCTDEHGHCVGGIVSKSYCNGKVTGSWCVGGLVGSNLLLVSNSYSTASVTGYSHVGGLVGLSVNGTVSSSYSTGSVTGDHDVGGLVGVKVEHAAVSNSFWDRITSGKSTSAGGTGKYTPQMHDIGTFSGAGWKIIAVANPDIRNSSYTWNIVDGQTYPFLSWQPTS